MRSPRRFLVAVAAATLAASVKAAEPAAPRETPPPRRGVVELEIDGVDGEQRAAVEALLDIARYTTRGTIGSGRLARLLDEAPGEVAEALEPFGYYAPRSTVTRSDLPGRRHRVVIRIERGEPVRVTSVTVAIDGAAADEASIKARIAGFKPAVGDVLEHRVYEAGKASVVRALQRLGYFDAERIEHTVEVTRATRSAAIRLRWRSGPRYAFGAVSWHGGQFPEPFLARFLPWREGDLWDQARIEALQQRLAASGYFGSLEIEPLLEARADARVPLRITLTPSARSVWSVGAYYETTYGAGARLGLERRWVNDRGHTLRGELEWAQQLGAATFEYRIPHGSIDGAQWLLGAARRDEDTASVDSRSALVRAGVLGARGDWTGLATLNALRGSFIVGRQRSGQARDRSTALYVELSAGRAFARDRIRPRRGAALRVTTRAASTAIGSDIDLLQLRAEGRYVLPAGERARVLARLELGWTETDDFAALPPELRFFAGGVHSVRGYGWQDLGPRDPGDKPVGGRGVATASLEYERSFRPDWSLAVFADAGNVFDAVDAFRAAAGAGIGLRWSSPIGPIRLDLAHGFDDPQRRVTLHFSAGPDL